MLMNYELMNIEDFDAYKLADGTPTLFTLRTDNKRIYKYMVNNHKWTRKHIIERNNND